MKLYNTLTKKLEEIKPINTGKINLFVCGPTVYDYSHLGHAKTYVQLDLLARVIKSSDYKLDYLQNITDIDDKIIARAAEQGIKWQDLTKKFEQIYKEDMSALNNTSVTKYASATDHVPDIIRQVQTLLDKGHAYKIDDGIYFEVATYSGYGKLSGRTEVKKDDAQTRIDHSDEKKGWNDFCLWKFPKEGEPTWEAPFGQGRPGWHIEDTAITEHFFGAQYDIHGGAIDLIFPHHEAEITQMESISGKTPMVNTWVHTGFLNIDKTKMSKSLGNFATIRQAIEKGYDPLAIRLLMLQSHYRSSINFTWDSLDAAASRLKNLQAFADLRFQPTQKSETNPDQISDAQKQILDCLLNDLDTPNTLGELSKLETQLADKGISKDAVELFTDFIKWLDEILGLKLSDSANITPDQKTLVEDRQKARAQKNWDEADKIRSNLESQGILLRDLDTSQIWYRG